MITDNDSSLTDHTRRVWQPRARRALTDEDCREIQRNIFGFLGVLRDWTDADRQQSESKPSADPATANSTEQHHIQS